MTLDGINAMPTSVQGFIKTCREHPAKVDETYFEHMLFAARMSARLAKAAAAAMLHAIVPGCCETTASREICAMHKEITERNAGSHVTS